MTLDEIEKEFENAFSDSSIENDLVFVWASNYAKQLIDIAKTANKVSYETDHMRDDSCDDFGLTSLANALEELRS